MEDKRQKALLQNTQSSSSEEKMINIIVNIPCNTTISKDDEYNAQSQLLFQGKSCRLYIENNNPLSNQKTTLSPKSHNFIYDTKPSYSKIIMQTSQKNKDKKRLYPYVRTETTFPKIIPKTLTFSTKQKPKHFRLYSQLTTSTAPNTTKNKNSSNLIKHFDFKTIRKKKLSLMYNPLKNNSLNNTNDLSKFSFNKTDFFFS